MRNWLINQCSFQLEGSCPKELFTPAVSLLGEKTVMLRWTKLMVWTLRLPRCDSPAFSLLWCTTDPPEAAAEYGMSFVVWEGYMGLSEHGAHEIPWYDKYPHSGPHWIMRIPNEQYFVCRSPYGYGPWVKNCYPPTGWVYHQKWQKVVGPPWSLILTHSHGNHELIHEFRYWSSTYLYMYVCNVCNVM